MTILRARYVCIYICVLRIRGEYAGVKLRYFRRDEDSQFFLTRPSRDEIEIVSSFRSESDVAEEEEEEKADLPPCVSFLRRAVVRGFPFSTARNTN